MEKIALVTGGSGGIGAEIVRFLAEKKMKVVFTYHSNTEKAEKLAQELREKGFTVEAIRADLKDPEDAKKLVQAVMTLWSRIDVLVNNAGIVRDSTLLMMSSGDWSEVIDTNLNGVFNVTRSVIYPMLRQRSGRIVNVSSTSGISGATGQTNYSASKAGIIGFSRALAKEVAAYGISVNVVAPAGVKTDMLGSISEKAREGMLHSIPLGRFCEPEEVAGVVGYLATESPAFMTGSVLLMDGGSGLG